ncbi:putative salutaridine reductase (NADPH) [Helianthus anomalus]
MYIRFGLLLCPVNKAGVVSTTVDDEESFWSIDLPSEIKDEKAKQAKKIVTQTFEGAQKCMETNYYGAKHVTQALLTLLLKSNSPRVVNVSSKLGQLENVQDESARKILSDVDGLTEEVVDEVVKEYLKDVKDEELLKRKGGLVMFVVILCPKRLLTRTRGSWPRNIHHCVQIQFVLVLLRQI